MNLVMTKEEVPMPAGFRPDSTANRQHVGLGAFLVASGGPRACLKHKQAATLMYARGCSIGHAPTVPIHLFGGELVVSLRLKRSIPPARRRVHAARCFKNRRFVLRKSSSWTPSRHSLVFFRCENATINRENKAGSGRHGSSIKRGGIYAICKRKQRHSPLPGKCLQNRSDFSAGNVLAPLLLQRAEAEEGLPLSSLGENVAQLDPY